MAFSANTLLQHPNKSLLFYVIVGGCVRVCYLSFDEKLYQRVEQHRKSFVVQKIKTILAGCKQLNVQIFDIT